MNDARILRSRNQDLANYADRRVPRCPDGGVSILAQTTTGVTYPTAAGLVYLCLTVECDGAETEGATPTFTTGNTVPAINIGSAIPPSGTMVICHSVGARWVFGYNG